MAAPALGLAFKSGLVTCVDSAYLPSLPLTCGCMKVYEYVYRGRDGIAQSRINVVVVVVVSITVRGRCRFGIIFSISLGVSLFLSLSLPRGRSLRARSEIPGDDGGSSRAAVRAEDRKIV